MTNVPSVPDYLNPEYIKRAPVAATLSAMLKGDHVGLAAIRAQINRTANV